MNKVAILNSIKSVVAEMNPAKAFLFGSQARGNARADSDWDVLVLIDKEGRPTREDYDNYNYPIRELGWKLNAEINPILYTLNDWNNMHASLFNKNVEQEGIVIWG